MRWPPFKHLFFDCDSTLTGVEGIDIMAESARKKWRVETLTNAAMDGKLPLEEVYAKRLRAIKPTREQIREIRRVYKRYQVEDAKTVIAALQAIGTDVYIISGGLAEPVEEFGIYLGIPRNHIRAVQIDFDGLAGNWWETDFQDHLIAPSDRYLDFEEGALTVSDGKSQIVREFLSGRSGRSLLIGDGTSDLLAADCVDLFIGYGGIVKRNRVAKEAPVYLQTESLAPLLSLAAGPAAQRQFDLPEHRLLFEKGRRLIETGALHFNDERLKSKFQRALSATY